MGQGVPRPRSTCHPFSNATEQACVNEKPTTPDSWSICAQTVQKYDETIVRNWKEEIDTLLVFVRVSDVRTPSVGLTGE
jgi:hypothetical protein